MSDNKKPEALEFATVLLQHRKGIEHDRATETLRDAVEAVKQTGKAAKVAVAVEIKPVSNVPNAVKLTVKVNETIPEEIESSMWFTDDDGGLHRNDPTQRPLWEDTPADQSTIAGRELAVPQNIQLALRPWEGHPKLYTVPAYFRLDISEGALSLAIKLFPTRETLREAWADLTQVITEAVAKPVYAQP